MVNKAHHKQDLPEDRSSVNVGKSGTSESLGKVKPLSSKIIDKFLGIFQSSDSRRAESSKKFTGTTEPPKKQQRSTRVLHGLTFNVFKKNDSKQVGSAGDAIDPSLQRRAGQSDKIPMNVIMAEQSYQKNSILKQKLASELQKFKAGLPQMDANEKAAAKLAIKGHMHESEVRLAGLAEKKKNDRGNLRQPAAQEAVVQYQHQIEAESIFIDHYKSLQKCLDNDQEISNLKQHLASELDQFKVDLPHLEADEKAVTKLTIERRIDASRMRLIELTEKMKNDQGNLRQPGAHQALAQYQHLTEIEAMLIEHNRSLQNLLQSPIG